MEELDPQLQKRVWQRVMSRDMPPLGREDLTPWLNLAQENAAAYQRLARQSQGKQGAQLRRLEGESQRLLACLRGLCRIRGERGKAAPPPQSREPAARTLEKCVHRERRLWEYFTQRSADPEQGHIYAALAQQTQNRCILALEILGRME